MIIGIITALIAGTMLGLYALPGKYTKDFEFENTWGLFFMLTMFVVPVAATFGMMKGVGEIYAAEEVRKALPVMIVASVLWGIGVKMWGQAIHHIGLSLGFSLFIGTVILVGSILPIGLEVVEKGMTGLPPTVTLILILVGILVILTGIFLNGRAGLIRETDEQAKKDETSSSESVNKSMVAGIIIAVIGGLLATGFNVAFTVGGTPLSKAVAATGNAGWMLSMAVMLPIFLSGGVILAGDFGIQLTRKKLWKNFGSKYLMKNFVLILIMAVFHYAASAAYAFGASRFDLGPVVVYAIFNTTCVAVAVVSGLLTREWVNASSRAKMSLYTGLSCMILGVVILSLSKLLESGNI